MFIKSPFIFTIYTDKDFKFKSKRPLWDHTCTPWCCPFCSPPLRWKLDGQQYSCYSTSLASILFRFPAAPVRIFSDTFVKNILVWALIHQNVFVFVGFGKSGRSLQIISHTVSVAVKNWQIFKLDFADFQNKFRIFLKNH